MQRLLLLLLLGLALPVSAQTAVEGGHGGAAPTDEITDAQRAEIWQQIEAARARLIGEGRLAATPSASALPALAFPLRSLAGDDDGYYGISNFVDRTPGTGVSDFACNARSYDGHRGLDVFTWPFPWEKMDASEVEVVAAAAGTILFRENTRPDRSCSFNGLPWNAVYIQHADGSVAWYGHLKTGSATPKGVGETVEAGERLGVVGSSGNSTGPHLHLELYDAAGALVDPFAGACNAGPSAWQNQEPYYVTSISSVQTHRAAPVNASCPSTQDASNRASTFRPGERLYLGSYYRDQFQGQTMVHRLSKPDGSVYSTWTGALSQPYFPASWWYYSFDLPLSVPVGTWTYRVEFEGDIAERTFEVLPPVAGEAAPGAVEILGPRPNPTAGRSGITLRLDETQRVSAEVYDAQGRRVAEAFSGPLGAGEHVLPVETAGLPAGVYVVRVAAGAYRGAFPLTVAR